MSTRHLAHGSGSAAAAAIVAVSSVNWAASAPGSAALPGGRCCCQAVYRSAMVGGSMSSTTPCPSSAGTLSRARTSTGVLSLVDERGGGVRVAAGRVDLDAQRHR